MEVKDATIKAGDRLLATRLSFMAEDGRLTCITGPEGSGKTALLRTLLGFLPVSEGYVSVDGELLTVSSAHAFRRMMVYLPQQMARLRHQLCPPEAPCHEAGERTFWASELSDVKPLVAAPASPLSPEEIVLLAEQTFERAADKPIVIADEPAALLPPLLAERMLSLLRRQVDAGKTVLIASRRPLLVGEADKIVELKRDIGI